MSIIVKGMEMPNSCYLCCFYNGLGCNATKKIFPMFTNVAIRREDCPLVEVSPHGRLIDAGKMKEQLENSLAITLPQIPVEYRKVFGSVLDAYIRFIDDVPTVIPPQRRVSDVRRPDKAMPRLSRQSVW